MALYDNVPALRRHESASYQTRCPEDARKAIAAAVLNSTKLKVEAWKKAQAEVRKKDNGR